ncbi:MAG: polysaccharide deacetylase family protein [Acidimicrobiales bacterium]|nr:polysaccharide deacetylase family protein [Acidimicrobiales bacterium]
MSPRTRLKEGLGRLASNKPAAGLTVLVYHRVGGGTPDERDISTDAFTAQLDQLAERHRVVSLDDALDALAAGDDAPRVAITFDDGFADVADPALPLLVERHLPFTVYVATAYVGGDMHWEGSTAKASGRGLDWSALRSLVASGLCTVGNHTHTHARPEVLTEEELDRCTAELQEHLGITPQHFAYTWGIAVPAMEPALRSRFRSAATGEVGRNHPSDDPLRLRRVPVRGTDPLGFFAAKLTGRLLPERTYGALVASAKRAGARG